MNRIAYREGQRADQAAFGFSQYHVVRTHPLSRTRYFRWAADVSLSHMRIGTSSSVCDLSQFPQKRRSEAVEEATEDVGAFVADRVDELMAALSLSKSLLAQVMRVSRPTIYEWLAGKLPNEANEERLEALLGVLGREGVSGATPLNARFVRRQPRGAKSIIGLLSAEHIDEGKVVTAIRHARSLEHEANHRRSEREARLRQLGFAEPDQEQRRENLAGSTPPLG